MRAKTDDINSASPIGVDLKSDVAVKKLLARQNDSTWWHTPKVEEQKKPRPTSPGRKPSFRVTAHRTNSNGTKHRQTVKKNTASNRVAALATKFDSLDNSSEVKVLRTRNAVTLPKGVTLTTKPAQTVVVKKRPSARGSKVRQVVSNFEQGSVKTLQSKVVPKPSKLLLDLPNAGPEEKKNIAISQVPKDGSGRKTAQKGDFRNGKTKKTEGRSLVVIDFEDGGNIDGEPHGEGSNNEDSNGSVTIMNVGKTDLQLPIFKKSEATVEGNQVDSFKEKRTVPPVAKKPGHKQNGVSSTTSASKVNVPRKSERPKQDEPENPETTPVENLSVSDKTKLFIGLKHSAAFPNEASDSNKFRLTGSVPKHLNSETSDIETNKSKLFGSLPKISTPTAGVHQPIKSKLYGSLQKHSIPGEPAVEPSKFESVGSSQKSSTSEAAEALQLNTSKLYESLQTLTSVEESGIPVANTKFYASLAELQSENFTAEDPLKAVNKSKVHRRLQKHSITASEVPVRNKSKLHGSLQKHSTSAPETPELNKSKLPESLQNHSAEVPVPNKSKLHGSLTKTSVSEISKSDPTTTSKPDGSNSLEESSTPELPLTEANASFLWRKTSTPVPPSNSSQAEKPDRLYTAIPVMIESEYDDVGPGENIYDDIGVHVRTSPDVHAEGYETCDGSIYDDCEGEGYQFVDGNASHNISDVHNVYDDVGVTSAEPCTDHVTEANYEAIDLKPRPLPMPPSVVMTPNSLSRTGYVRPVISGAVQQSMGRQDSISSSASSSRSGSGGTQSFCEKINSIYGGVLPDLGAALNGIDVIVRPPSETSDEWIDEEDDGDSSPAEHNAPVGIRGQHRRRNGRWSRNVRSKWRSRQGPRVDAGISSSDTDVENQYETLGEVKNRPFDNHVDQKINYDGFDSFDSESDDERNFPIHTANLHVDVSHITNGRLPSPPARENIYGVRVMRIKEAAGKGIDKLRKNWSMRKNDISTRINRMRRKSSVDPVEATEVTEKWSPTMEKSRSSTQITNSTKYFSFKKNWRRSSSTSLAGLEVKSSTFYLTEVDICDKNGRSSPIYGGSTHADTASNISASSSTEGRSSPRSSPGGVIRRPFLPAPPHPPPAPPNNLPDRKTSSIVRPRSPPPPPPVPQRNYSREVEKDWKVNSPSLYAECNLLGSNGGNDASEICHARKPSRQDEPTNGSISPYAAAGLYGGSQDINASDMSDSSIGHNSSGSVKHLFCDEPLYQFYNVSISEQIQRYHNELDSDGYEEIIDGVLKPRPSAMELIRPKDGKHRTLWCEIPEVINSHVLGSLSTMSKKLQEAKFELITSEASYQKSLNVLVKHFIRSPELTDESVLPKADRHVLFAGIDPVKRSSESFLADLEKCWQKSIMLEGICKIVYEHAKDNFNVYTKYCTNQFYLDKTLRKLRDGGGRLSEALIKLESAPECQSLSLHSFLMLPMQRITRLPLLLDAVLRRLNEDSDEYNVCKLALASLNKIVANCNEGARKMERYEEMMRLSQQLKFPQDVKSIPIYSSKRWLVRSGSLTQVFRKEDAKLTFGRKLQRINVFLFLFNDILFVTKRKHEDQYTVIDYCPRNYITIETLQQPDIAFLKSGEVNRHYLQFILLKNNQDKTVEMILSCESESDSKRWLSAVSPPKSENPGEILYESWDCPQVTTLHPYVASQPDELSLNVGDVVNVLRKLDDGWFEGERIRDCERGWFPGNHTLEVASAHVKAKNFKQRYRFLRFSASYLEHEKVNGK